jgi:O-antigen/teichoic acid export membrane protein
VEEPGVSKAQAPLSLVASLRANATWTLLGNLAYAGCQWGMLVAFAKFGDARMVGEFGLGLAITGPVFMFANLQLASVLATDAAGTTSFADYFGARVTTTVTALLASCALSVATHGSADAPAVVVAVAATKSIESLSDIFHGLFQRREAMDRMAKSMALRGVLSLAAVVLAVRAFGTVVAAAIAVACVSSAVLIGFDLPNGAALLGGLRGVFPRFGVRQLAAIVRLALPLGIVTMLISLTANIPRYFLEDHGGPRDLGIFVGLAYIVTASGTVVGAIGRAATPRLANLHAAGQMLAFRGLVRMLLLSALAIGAAGVLVVLLAGRQLLQVLYTPEYAAHASAFAVVMFSGGIGYAASMLGYAVTAGRHFLVQIPLWIAAAASTLAGSALLVSRHGVTGAAWVLVLTASVQLLSYGLLYARCVLRPPHRG